jgi:hypothetical protein
MLHTTKAQAILILPHFATTKINGLHTRYNSMTLLSRLSLLFALLAVLAAFTWLFRRVGLGEVAIVVSILALAFGVEIVRFLVMQVLKGYRGGK